MRRLKPLDAAWLYVDSPETPMHVAGLQIFKLPDDAPPDFLTNLWTRMREAQVFASPWNLRLQPSPLRGILPAWVVENDLDIDYHFRHSALPRPGGERELGILVSRLHSHPLDTARPLWECHLIEGLENGRFALYTKMHHALVDGVGGMRLAQRALSPDPEAPLSPIWSIGNGRSRRSAGPRRSVAEQAREGFRRQFGGLPQAGRALFDALLAGRDDEDPLSGPFSAPESVLNRRIAAARRFATQQYSLPTLKKMAAKVDGTLNDVVLALCSGALRRYLKENGVLPPRPLNAGIPVSVRPVDDDEVGTAISFIVANLATDIADPLRRLATIRDSTRAAKRHLQTLPGDAINQYTMMMMGPYVLQLLTGLGGRTRPMFNLTISNVPGPDQALYFGGARLEAMYPVSLVTHGQALNITCVSYADTLNVGFTGCRDTLPHMQRLAVYTGEAFDELRAACGIR